jgi:hypothetical protein
MNSFQRNLLTDALRVLEEERVLLATAAERELSADDMLVILAELGRRNAEIRQLMARVGTRVGLPTGARARILRYLQVTKGKVVDKEELSGVSGIYEWARRVRELRVEEGWRISSDDNRPDLRPGQYLLESMVPDPDVRSRWQIAHRIRRAGGSAPERVLAFLRSNVGRTVSSEELYYVSQDHDFEGIVERLASQGWTIRSHADAMGLRPGQYRLESERT